MSQAIPDPDSSHSDDAERLLVDMYDELRNLAAAKLRNEPAGQTLQATALVHEAWLRLMSSGSAGRWSGRAHFFGAAAEAMRRILIERARHKNSVRAGGDLNRVSAVLDHIATPAFDFDLIALDDGLKRLEATVPRIAEVVKLRYFAGLTLKEIAEVLSVAESTVDADWAYAKSWLRVRLAESSPAPESYRK